MAMETGVNTREDAAISRRTGGPSSCGPGGRDAGHPPWMVVGVPGSVPRKVRGT